MHPVWLGAQPKCCGKAKEFGLRGRNGKGKNRISGTTWALGTGNASVMGKDFGILCLLLSPAFPTKEMHPYFEPDQNRKLIFRHFTGI